MMCGVCRCGTGEVTVDGCRQAGGEPVEHKHHRTHCDGGAMAEFDIEAIAGHASAPGINRAHIVEKERDIFAKNAGYAERNRRRFAADQTLALNLVSSPGAGKTTLLTQTIAGMRANLPIAVIEGDQQTSHDDERIRATGVQTVQVNTRRGCHLDAHTVGHALDRLTLVQGGLLLIENVGNLVCPAAFDLGEAHRVVILSVTEGEDMPLKYPDMFHAADLMIINKVDLLPYVNFDVEQCTAHARRVNPGIDVLPLSSTRWDGMCIWYAWLQRAAGLQRENAQRALPSKPLQRRPIDRLVSGG